MNTDSVAAKTRLLDMLHRFGIRSAEPIADRTTYEHILRTMVMEVQMGGLDPKPGSVIATLLKAVAAGIMAK